MSRIGKQPIPFASGTKVNVSDSNLISIKGGKHELNVQIDGPINVGVEGAEILVKRENDEPKTRALHGLYRSLLSNAVVGVEKGWEKTLLLNGVGYRAAVSGKNLELSLGYSHPVVFPIPAGIEIKVEKQTSVKVAGPDKAQVGQVSAVIRGFRPPEPFLGKGIKYSDEHIRRKAGKSGAK